PTNPPVPPNESLVDESRAAADLGHQAFQKLDDPQMNEVVPGGKDHQRQHQRQTEPKAIFLRALAKRLPPNGLSGIKQEMPPVKNGNRKEVDEAEIDRQHRHEPEHGDNSALRHLARHLRDAQGAAELVGGARADDHLPHGLERSRRHVEGLAAGAPHRIERVAAHILNAAALDPQQPHLMRVAEAIGDGADLRRDGERHILAAALDDELHRHAGIEAHEALHILETLDLLAIDRDEDIAGLQAALLRRASGQNLADLRRGERLAHRGKEHREDRDRENEIGARTRHDHGGALRQALVMEGDFALLGGHRLELARRHRRGIGIAEHFHIAAERHQAEFPARAGAVVPAENLRAEADREHLDAHAVPARDEVVAELVHEHQHRQNDDEWNEVIEAAGQKAHESNLCTRMRLTIAKNCRAIAEKSARFHRVYGWAAKPGPQPRRSSAPSPAVAVSNESRRSSSPPWPGMSAPESLAPKRRLASDSARSPPWAKADSTRLRTTVAKGAAPAMSAAAKPTIPAQASPP